MANYASIDDFLNNSESSKSYSAPSASTKSDQSQSGGYASIDEFLSGAKPSVAYVQPKIEMTPQSFSSIDESLSSEGRGKSIWSGIGSFLKSGATSVMGALNDYRQKSRESTFFLSQMGGGNLYISKDPVTGKQKLSTPELDAFRSAQTPEEKEKVLSDYEKEAPILKAMNSDIGQSIIKGIGESTQHLPLKTYARILSVGDQTYEEARDSLIAKSEDPNNPRWQQILYGVENALPQSAIGVLLAVGSSLATRNPAIGRAIGGSYFGSVSANEEMKKNASGEIERLSQLGNIGIDVIGDNVISGLAESTLKNFVKKRSQSKLKDISKAAGQGFFVEGTTEPIQSILKYANDYTAAGTEEQKSEVVRDFSSYIKNGGLLNEFLIGGIAGGAINSAASGLSIYANNITKKDGDLIDPDKFDSIKESIQDDVKEALESGDFSKVINTIENEGSLDEENAKKVIQEVAQDIAADTIVRDPVKGSESYTKAIDEATNLIKSGNEDFEVAKALQEYVGMSEDRANEIVAEANFRIQEQSKPVEVISEKPKKTTKTKKEEAVTEEETAKILRGTKGMTAADIMKTHPNIQLTKEVVAKDVHGNKRIIPEGEKLTPYELKDGKILLQDGETYLVTKNQFRNIQGNSIGGEAKPFAPEFQGLEETIKGGRVKETPRAKAKAMLDEAGLHFEKDMPGSEGYLTDRSGEPVEYDSLSPELQRAVDKYIGSAETVRDIEPVGTKYSKYTLPGGKNYKEILIKAPVVDKPLEKLPEGTKTWNVGNSGAMETPNGQRLTFDLNGGDLDELALKALNKNRKSMLNIGFRSSHWDEPNVLAHIRVNERTYEGEPVTFLEELQSDWAREARTGKTEATSPLLKNWQELAIKRALKEAVDNGSKYFAWINGEQTSARYNLSKQIENVDWKSYGEDKIVKIKPTGGRSLDVAINNEGVVTSRGNDSQVPAEWQGKKLDEVLGKGLADKIMEKESGTLSGEGLKFGGEWAINLYDKQVGNVVKDLTGAKIETLDMGLPVDKISNDFYITEPGGKRTERLSSGNMKVGDQIIDEKNKEGIYYVITDILGENKFKAIPKSEASKQEIDGLVNGENINDIKNSRLVEEFSIAPQTTTQQGIEITPEIKARILGESPIIEIEKKEEKIKLQTQKTTKKVSKSKGKAPKKEVKVNEVAVAKKVIPKKTSLPILSNVVVRDGKMEFSDLNISVRVDTTMDDGVYKIIGKDFVPNSDFKEGDYPDIPFDEKGESHGEVNAQEFSSVLDMVSKSIDEDSIKQEITAVFVEIKNGVMRLTGTDSFRLSSFSIPVNGAKDGSFLILEPSKLSETLKLLGNKNISLQSNVREEDKKSTNTVLLSNDSGDILARTVNGSFPEYERIYPSYTYEVSFDREELKDAIKNLKSYNKKVVYISQKDGKFYVKAKNEGGDEKSIELSTKGKKVSTTGYMSGILVMPQNPSKNDPEDTRNTLKFDPNMLNDAVNSFDSDSVYIKFTSEDNISDTYKPIHLSDIEAVNIEVKKPGRKASGEASTGAQAIGKFEQVTDQNNGYQNIKLFDEVKKLVQKYAKNVGEGYLPSGALGVYYGDTQNIRVTGMNDLSVASHEISHFLDTQYNITSGVMEVKGYSKTGTPIYKSETAKERTDLTKLYTEYYPNAKATQPLRTRMREGYATLVQKYIEMPKTIENKYPFLVKEFLKPGGKYYNKIVMDMVEDSRNIVEAYQGMNALDKVGARMTSDRQEAEKGGFMNFFDSFKTEVSDYIFPLEKVAKGAKVLNTKFDPSLWARMYNNVSSLVLNNINSDRGYWGFRNGEFKKIHDFNWKTLVESIQSQKATEEFGSYLIARRQYFDYQELKRLKEDAQNKIELVQRLGKDAATLIPISGGKSPVQEATDALNSYKELKQILDRDGFTEKEVTDAYLENKDKFQDETEMFDTLTREDLVYMNDPMVQLLTNEEFNELSSKEGYASFKRDFYDELVGEEEKAKQFKVGKTKVSSMLKRKGSSRAIINPLLSGIKAHGEITKKGLKQTVYNRIADIGINAIFPELFQKIELRAIPDQNGRISYPQEKDDNIIMARVNYKRVPIVTDSLIKRVVDETFTVDNIGIMEQLWLGASRIFTKGTTAAFVGFTVTNYTIDQITATAQSQTGYIAVLSQVKELSKVLMDGEQTSEKKYFMEYLTLGGERQTLAGWQDMTPNELFKKVSGEVNGLQKVIEYTNKGVDILAIPSKYSEIATRATEYIRSRQAGDTSIVALEKAGRVSAPFHHIGRLGGSKFMVNVIKSIPYFNAIVQALTQSAETLGRDKKSRQRYILTNMALIGAMIAGYSLIYSDGTDDQKKLYEGLSPEELSKYVYYPNDDGKTLGKLRVPDQMAFIGAVMNMAFTEMMGRPGYAPDEYMRASTAWVPAQLNPAQPVEMFLSWIPQVFKPGIEVAFGVKSFPNVQPLESMSLQKLPEPMRFTKNTSPVAKELGEKLDMSPIKIDHFLTGYFGRSVGYVTGKPGVYNPFSILTQKNYFTSGRQVQEFYDLKEEYNQKNSMFTRQIKEGESIDKKERDKTKKFLNEIKPIEKDLDEYRDLDIEEDSERAFELRIKILNNIDNIVSVY